MVSSGRHAKKAVANALRQAERAGLDVLALHRGHRWGELRCERCGASRDVWSSPRDQDVHAKQLNRFVVRHTHRDKPR